MKFRIGDKVIYTREYKNNSDETIVEEGEIGKIVDIAGSIARVWDDVNQAEWEGNINDLKKFE